MLAFLRCLPPARSPAAQHGGLFPGSGARKSNFILLFIFFAFPLLISKRLTQCRSLGVPPKRSLPLQPGGIHPSASLGCRWAPEPQQVPGSTAIKRWLELPCAELLSWRGSERSCANIFPTPGAISCPKAEFQTPELAARRPFIFFSFPRVPERSGQSLNGSPSCVFARAVAMSMYAKCTILLVLLAPLQRSPSYLAGAWHSRPGGFGALLFAERGLKPGFPWCQEG